MKYKYIILDFGNVLVTPATGDWHITPRFKELIDTDKMDKEAYEKAYKKHCYLLGTQLFTLEEEYDMLFKFYDNILKDMKYSNHAELAKDIAKDRTYKHDKYAICENIIEELTYLKSKYKLLLLTDNWPCVIPYLKDYNLYDFFDKVYVSSIYGTEKKEGTFFDYPIKDYDIKPGEALFIDDSEINLDVAKEKGLDVLLMDRYKSNIKSKYKIINDLMNL